MANAVCPGKVSSLNIMQFGGCVVSIQIEPLEFPFSLGELMDLVEKRAMEAALIRTHGNKMAASKSLGIWRASFDRKVKKYGLDGYGKPQV